MSTYQEIFAQSKSGISFVPEFEGDNVSALVNTHFAELLQRYPPLSRYHNYLDFLNNTGGAHIHDERFSLGIYGFGGYLVPSFDEGEFLDNDRYFQFADVMYYQDPELVFAFDFESNGEDIYIANFKDLNYFPVGCDFYTLLKRFADDQLPGYDLV